MVKRMNTAEHAADLLADLRAWGPAIPPDKMVMMGGPDELKVTNPEEFVMMGGGAVNPPRTSRQSFMPDSHEDAIARVVATAPPAARAQAFADDETLAKRRQSLMSPGVRSDSAVAAHRRYTITLFETLVENGDINTTGEVLVEYRAGDNNTTGEVLVEYIDSNNAITLNLNDSTSHKLREIAAEALRLATRAALR